MENSDLRAIAVITAAANLVKILENEEGQIILAKEILLLHHKSNSN
jgi:hypothetical protein